MAQSRELTTTSVGKQILLQCFNSVQSGETIELVEERDIIIRRPDGTSEYIDRRYRLIKRKI